MEVDQARQLNAPGPVDRRAVKGDEEPAELVVFAFPGGAGGVEANVKRWQSRVQGQDGNPPKIDTKVVKGKNVEVTRVEIAGHYVAAVLRGAQR